MTRFFRRCARSQADPLIENPMISEEQPSSPSTRYKDIGADDYFTWKIIVSLLCYHRSLSPNEAFCLKEFFPFGRERISSSAARDSILRRSVIEAGLI